MYMITIPLLYTSLTNMNSDVSTTCKNDHFVEGLIDSYSKLSYSALHSKDELLVRISPVVVYH